MKIRYLGSNQYKSKRPWYRSSWMAIAAWVILIVLVYVATHTFDIKADHVTIKRDAAFWPIPKAHAQTIAGKSAEMFFPTPTPTPTKEQIIFAHKHGDIIWHIYGLESSFGRADGCRAKGLYNGFGYRQNSSEWVCYRTFNEVVDHVEAWVEQHSDLPLGQMMCLYNAGDANTTDCNDANQFMKL